MREPTLPMSRGAVDRLGDRLRDADQIDEEDLDGLEQIVDAHQGFLDDLKAELAQLGYAATTRVKTTNTLVEKLRREDRMLLSRVQDLAGARVIVSNRPEQDDAAARVREHFEISGHRCKVVDRRLIPSHGYRALHLVVKVGPIQAEIQIRTELEDTWAQIVERLADQWGRAIRYGGEPIHPEAEVRAGQQVFSRREAVVYLAELGTSINEFELLRGTLLTFNELGHGLGRLFEYVAQSPVAQDHRMISHLPEQQQTGAMMVMSGLNLISQPESSKTDPADATMAQAVGSLGPVIAAFSEENRVMLDRLVSQEQALRVTLQLIASASAEGE